MKTTAILVLAAFGLGCLPAVAADKRPARDDRTIEQKAKSGVEKVKRKAKKAKRAAKKRSQAQQRNAAR